MPVSNGFSVEAAYEGGLGHIYRLALTCVPDEYGDPDVVELERHLLTTCGPHWVTASEWRYEPPPISIRPTLPVVVPKAERDMLLTPLTGVSRVIDEIILSPGHMRRWRNLCFQRMPFTQPDGDHFPWETVQFRLPDASPEVRTAIAALAIDPWTIDGDILLVSPEDAAVIVTTQSADLFQYLGRARVGQDRFAVIDAQARDAGDRLRSPVTAPVLHESVEALIAAFSQPRHC